VSRVIVTEGAARGLRRCQQMLSEKSAGVAQRAAQAISQKIETLEAHPQIGRPLPNRAELRELIVEFGDSGYVALYTYNREEDTVYVLAFRHQKEAGY